MRVAYVCADAGVPVFGQKGCSIHVQEVVRALVRRGARIKLFTPRGQGHRDEELRSIEVQGLPLSNSFEPESREQDFLSVNDDLWALLDDHGPYDLVYERYSLWSYAAMEYARANGIPGILEVNSPLIDEQSQYRQLIDRQAAEVVAKRVFAAAAVRVAVSQEVARYLQAHLPPGEKAFVVSFGVDRGRFESRETCHRQTFTIGFVGTLKPWHGLAHLIDAFSHVSARDPTTRLLIVGDGPESEHLKASVADNGLAAVVRFTGAVSPTQIPGLLADIDVAVAPYPALERFYFSPLKVLEYMAAGVPVIASRCGQLEELIEHEVTGLLCSPGDAQQLAEALLRLRGDAALCRRLGQAGRKLVLQEHTWDHVVQRILSVTGVPTAALQS
jgi:glycosyltransferase involved in cell wall biosynthesis